MAVQMSVLTRKAKLVADDSEHDLAILRVEGGALPASGLGSSKDVREGQAAAYPGNSGSPLYGVETGPVIGVINSVYVKKSKETAISSPSGISYAVPVDHVRALLKKAGVGQ